MWPVAAHTSKMMHNSVDHIPVRIAFVGGGSLNWAMGLMSDLAFDTRLAADVRLYDIDRPAAQRNAVIGNHYTAVSRGSPAKYRACETLTEALEGADIVVISILPGGFEDMAHDIDIPLSHGIPQSVGDTVGPGGFVRALRAIPMLADIGRAIRETAPEAFVCNLTNPMSALTGALYAVYPRIRAWGECHEVTKIRRQVAWIANCSSGTDHYSHRDVSVNVLGINHFTFVDAIAVDGQDYLPAYRDFVRDHQTAGWAQTEPGQNAEHAKYFGTRNLVAFDLLRRFGIPAAAGDRHLAEFLPAADYLAEPERWGFAMTPVSYRIRDREAKLARARALQSGDIAPVAKRSDEALIDQIVALMGGAPFVSNVNLPNTGQLKGLPMGAIVETNATFSDQGAAPVAAGRLPEQLEPLVRAHSDRQTALVAAVLAGDRAALLPLFREDPLVAPLPDAQAERLLEEMIAATAAWVPETLRGAA